MAFELPNLPYAADALEPHIDKQTMKSIMTNTTTRMFQIKFCS